MTELVLFILLLGIWVTLLVLTIIYLPIRAPRSRNNNVNEEIAEIKLQEASNQDEPAALAILRAETNSTETYDFSVENIILFPLVIIDSPPGFNVLTGEYTVPASGVYQTSVDIIATNSFLEEVEATMNLVYNGIIVATVTHNVPNNSSNVAFSLTHTASIFAGQIIKVVFASLGQPPGSLTVSVIPGGTLNIDQLS